MKRYIRASFDASMPEWLKRKFDSKYSRINGDAFVKRFGCALSDVEFTKNPTEGSFPIYYLKFGNSHEVYVPGVNDDENTWINGRSRKLGSIAKSKLKEYAEDIVYFNPKNNPRPKDRGYQDPRYSYSRYDRKGKGHYAGQYYSEYGEESKWDTFRPSNETRDRDKSGYKIPSPESQLARYYKKFPSRVKQKVEQVYQRLIQVRDKVVSEDVINSPRQRDESMSLGSALSYFSSAVEDYRNLLSMLDKSGRLSGKNEYGWEDDNAVGTFSNKIKDINYRLDEAERYLTSRW